jgi:cation/acetate symporter
LRFAAYAVAAVALAAAALGAFARPAGVVEVATWGLTLAATGLFPALFAALWWPRASAWGAGAGMLVGLAVALVYIIGTQLVPVPFFEATSALSSGGAPGMEYFIELKDAWLAAEPGAVKDAARAALEAHARSVADWWGVSHLAIALLALPAGIAALVAVSLLKPAPRAMATVA